MVGHHGHLVRGLETCDRFRGRALHRLAERVEAAATVDEKQDGERQTVLAEVRNLLRHAILHQREVFALEIADDAPRLLLKDERVENDKVNVGLDDLLFADRYRRLFRVDDARARLWRWCLWKSKNDGQNREDERECECESLHGGFSFRLSRP